MSTRPETTERAFELLADLARDREALWAEFEGSLTEFFGGPPPAGDAGETLRHARRHLEWFLLERHSPSQLGVPAERLLDQWRLRADEEAVDRQGVKSLLESFAGVFQVTACAAEGEGAWVRDLAGLGDYALETTTPGTEVGDLYVGRLLPTGDALHIASRGTCVFRNAELTQAIERDLARARAAGAKVLHLSQLELERLFFRPLAQEPPGTNEEEEDPLAKAREVLAQGGISPERIDAIFARLAAGGAGASASLLPGAGDTLGRILEELAFETEVDLGRARTHLTRAWPLLAQGSGTGASPPARTGKGAREGATPAEGVSRGSGAASRREALARFDSARAAGGDLDELFSRLERDLDLAPGDSTGPHELGEIGGEDASPAPDFPGVVRAMIEEFRWDVQRSLGAARAAEHSALAPLGEFAARLGRFEELDAAQLLRFTAFWIPERAELDGSGARALLDSLRDFCNWTEEAHEMPLWSEFGSTLGGLRESLPRIVELNRLLPAPPPDRSGTLYVVQVDSQGRFTGLADGEGRAVEATLDPGLAARLRGGDRLRGDLQPGGTFEIYRCYPPEAGGLSV